ncbi:MAG: hypothetical protein QXG18_02745 [Candidatus Pacearchaeota archaeon]
MKELALIKVVEDRGYIRLFVSKKNKDGSIRGVSYVIAKAKNTSKKENNSECIHDFTLFWNGKKFKEKCYYCGKETEI